MLLLARIFYCDVCGDEMTGRIHFLIRLQITIRRVSWISKQLMNTLNLLVFGNIVNILTLMHLIFKHEQKHPYFSHCSF